MNLSKLFILAIIGIATITPDADAEDRIVNHHKLEGFLNDAADKGFVGVVGVSGPKGTLYLRGFGDAAPDKPYTGDTLADIASITKQFTGAAILKLAEQGKLKPENPISKFLDNIPEDKKSITLHHLLTHTAGLPDVVGIDEEKIDRRTYVKRALDAPLKFQPGQKYEYSNVGFSLLAAVIEIASGQSYEAYLYENLWQPAGMSDTGYFRPDWKARTVPQLQQPVNGMTSQKELLAKSEGKIWHLMGNGGILSTAEDMLKWHQALQGTDILSNSSKALLEAPHVPEHDEGVYHYGYGWSVVPNYGGKKLVWHNGGSYFSRTEFWRFPEDGTAFFIATHDSKVEPNKIADGLALLLLGKSPDPVTP